jgi:hypothetical protein
MKTTPINFIHMIAILVLVLGLAWGLTISVSAAETTCSWTAAGGRNWGTPGSWSCGYVPTGEDNVRIQPADYPADHHPLVNCAEAVPNAKDFLIEASGQVEFNGSTYCTVYASSFTNYGNLVVNFDTADYGLGINAAFNNHGLVDIKKGYLMLERGGTHSGKFVGEAGTILTIGAASWPNQTYNFDIDSQILVPNLLIPGGENGLPNRININGEFSPGLLADSSYMRILSQFSEVTFATQNILMPNEVTVSGKLTMQNGPEDGYTFYGLTLGVTGEMIHDQKIEIHGQFIWKGGVLAGSGDLVLIISSQNFIIRDGAHTLDGKNLISHTDTDWTKGNIALINGASFTNTGFFTALATTTMTGGVSESFINQGVLRKNTSATTTTMDIPTINHGEIQTLAGSLIFTQGMDSGENTTINLGNGTLEMGDSFTLNSGDSLVGSGTLVSNLVNAGLVSPGASPGRIAVDGDYDQQAIGTLDIELGGTSPGTSYDQLAITNAATLGGTLNISLIDGFTPAPGDIFNLITFASHTGSFAAVNLPELGPDLTWQLNYEDTALVLSVSSTGGSITGTVTYLGELPLSKIVVTAHLDLDKEPTASAIITHIGTSTISYRIDNLAADIYFVSAFVDKDEDGGPPLPDEPQSWFGEDDNGLPDEIPVQSGETITDIDITLADPVLRIFLPLILR